jgi:hypothetical protein
VLDEKEARIVEERSARAQPLTDAEVRGLLGKVTKVIVAKGKKSRTLKRSEVVPDDLKGPTGNYRAPMVLRGKTLLVGFNAELLGELV